MDASAIKAMMVELAPVIRDYVAERTASVIAENKALAERVAVIEARQPERGERGVGIEAAEKRDGVLILKLTDGTEQEVGKVDGEPGPAPDESAIIEAVRPIVETVARESAEQTAGAYLEENSDSMKGVGIAATDIRDGVLVIRLTDGSEQDVGPVVGKDGQPGQDAEPLAPEAVAETMRGMAQEMVSEAIAEGLSKLPPPEKGDPGAPGVPGEPGQPGKDGRGWAKSFVDRDGNLVATFTDGSTENLGCVVGKDGNPGRDGFGLDDFDCVPVDERTIALKFTRGDVCHSYELEFPVIIDRGVYKEDQTYVRGDAVTWGGSLWIAQKETSEKPDSPDSGWRLSVKKGRDGRDGKS